MNYLVAILLFTLMLGAGERQQCTQCHKEHTQSFERSHHAAAMQKASAKSVLGDFNNAKFNYNGIVSAFFKKREKFMVTTDNERGKLQTYEIAYTFGLYPLQQYMVKFPKGKVQVLDIAWDSRSKSDGGQRWFHLHPEDNVIAGDVLHWTGSNLNWNFMCADCHSTNLRKNYNPKTKSLNTKYDNITLTCASCHGNGDEHLAWAKNPKGFAGKNRFGLLIDLKKNRWSIDEHGKAKLDGNIDRTEVMMCAQCHSRRAQIADGYHPGKKFEDHYIPSMLDENLYFSNGAIKDEVYEYGSFAQSKMYSAGVSCSDCHSVHSLDRKTLNANVCNKCHQESKYTASTHTHHPKDAKNVDCITCHMPSRTYMGVDERNDHSFRLPRPDLSINSDNSNACNQCHKDKTAQWATDAMISWYGKVPQGHQNYTHALNALRTNSAKSPQFLYDVLMSNAPSIAKATVTEYLGNYPSRQTHTTTLQTLRSKEPSIRLQALRALEAFPPKHRTQATFEMLDDPIRSVRIEAARQLSALPTSQLDGAQKQKLKSGIEEYRQTLIYNADRAESQSALGALYANLKEDKKASEAYMEALQIAPKLIRVRLNYAHFLQTHNDDKKAFGIIQNGLKLSPNEPALHHALGLWYIRNNEPTKGMASLRQAYTLAPDDARFAYVYAVALAQTDINQAIIVLEKSTEIHSGDGEMVDALAYYYEVIGNKEKSDFYKKLGEKLKKFSPVN